MYPSMHSNHSSKGQTNSPQKLCIHKSSFLLLHKISYKDVSTYHRDGVLWVEYGEEKHLIWFVISTAKEIGNND